MAKQTVAQQINQIASTQNQIANMSVADMLNELGYEPKEVTSHTYIYIDTEGNLAGMEIRHPGSAHPEDEAVFVAYVGSFERGAADVRGEMILKKSL